MLVARPIPFLSACCALLASGAHAFHASKANGGASVSRTSLASTRAPSPPAKADGARTPPSEVRSKFDGYASEFEEHLVDNLKYCAPREVAAAAAERIAEGRDGRPYASALDAGCGTGLAGPPLRPLVTGPMVGVDLSPKMAELAAELVADEGNPLRRCSETARLAQAPLSRLYDGVFTADLLKMSGANFVEGYGHDVTEMPSAPFQLIVAADVLCYFGAMDEVLQAFSDRLIPGGDLIFTTETMRAGSYDWVETSSGRYAQDPGYVARTAEEAGLTKVSQEAFTPRMESGEKVLGTLHVFTKR